MTVMTTPPNMSDNHLLTFTSYNCRGNAPDRLCLIDRLMSQTDVLFVQEHWLYDWELNKLCSSPNLAVMGVSGMEPDRHRLGRPFGGCAMLYKSSLECSFSPVDTASRRIFATVAQFNCMQKYLLVCVYMPCDSRDRNSYVMFSEVLTHIESVLLAHPDVDYVIIGGDLNVDMKRADSERPPLLREFCVRLGLHLCSSPSIDYTYQNEATGVKSVIDHFIISENLCNQVIDFNVTHDGDNLSDHEPLHIAFSAVVERSRVATEASTGGSRLKRLAWHRATQENLNAYRGLLNAQLSDVFVPYEVIQCNLIDCTSAEHWNCIDTYHGGITQAILSAAQQCIPARRHIKQVAGWVEHVRQFQTDSIFWHSIWVSCGKPRQGWVADIRRRTRAQYKRASQWVLRNQEKLSAERMADALSENRQRDMWTEVKKVKCRGMPVVGRVDDAEGSEEACALFKNKYEELYSSVPFDQQEMSLFLDEVQRDIGDCCSAGLCECHCSIGVEDVKAAIRRLNPGKSDANADLSSDHFINASHDLAVHLSFLFKMMLSHCRAPVGMLTSVLVPIPKNRKKSLSDSSNYRSIALSSVIGKILDLVILKNHANFFATSDLQFGFKARHSTSQCTFVLSEVVNYYNARDTPVFVTLLDASKAFDRVQYVRLFRLLRRRRLCPSLLKLLVAMYVDQSLSVRWQGTTSEVFPCCNGIKQGGVLSPILFCVYFDELINRLSRLGVGCHVGHRFVGALSYADDLTLLSPTYDATCRLLKCCEDFAAEYDVLFNGTKSQVLLFESRGMRLPQRPLVRLNGDVIPYVERTLHLGTFIGRDSHDANLSQAAKDLFIRTKSLESFYGHCSFDTKRTLFLSYCTSFYGSVLWNLERLTSLAIAWRKCVRLILHLPPRTHTRYVPLILGRPSLEDELAERFARFWERCSNSPNLIVQMMSDLAREGTTSVMSRNVRFSDSRDDTQYSESDRCISNVIAELCRCRAGGLYCPLDLTETEQLIVFLCTND